MPLSIDVDVRTSGSEMDRDEIERVLMDSCTRALMAEGWKAAEVSIVVTDDEGIRSLNAEYREKDEPTDVLSFPLVDWGRDFEDPDTSDMSGEECDDSGEDEAEAVPLGDVVISLERARTQADEYGHSLPRELGYLCVHGILHLLGYDHQSDEERRAMREREEAILSEIGLIRD